MNVAFVSSSRSDIGLINPIVNYMRRQARTRVELVLVGPLASVRTADLPKGVRGLKLQSLKNRTSVKHIANQGQMMNAFSDISREFSNWLNKRKTPLDWIFLPGDRFEVLAAAIAGYYNNVPIAHLFGGDRSMGGHLDDNVRHAITKLAHVHFAVSADSFRRILRLGEERWRVHNVGSPIVEAIKESMSSGVFHLSELIVPRTYNILCTYNPITTESSQAGQQFDAILNAFRLIQKRLDVAFLLTFPNNEYGSRAIVARLKKVMGKPGYFVFPNLGDRYLPTLSQCDLVVGNSSSGLLEAPIVGTPTLNIGTRQEGRFAPSSVFHSRTYAPRRIARQMEAILRSPKRPIAHPYGRGHTSKMITAVLKTLARQKSRLDILQKKITY